MNQEILNAIEELKKQEKRKFKQSLDLIINLKDIDIKKQPVNTSAVLHHEIGKPIKICGFLTRKTKVFDMVLSEPEFSRLDKKQIKNLEKDYSYFVGSAKLMPKIATQFGKILGPKGKMPNPSIGTVVMDEDDKNLEEIAKKLKRIVVIKLKEKSFKTSIGTEDSKPEEIADTFELVYHALLNVLPKKKENIKSVLLKYTMSKPVKVKII